MKEYLFSYGTLQQEAVQLELFGRRLNGSSDCLQGYKAVPIELKDEPFSSAEGAVYLIAVHTTNKKDCIEGMVFELSDEELQQADQYEPEEYKRIQVLLQSGREAWVYAAFSNEVTGMLKI